MRNRVLGLALLAAFVSMSGPTLAQRPSPTVQVYKLSTCGCCANWVKHLEEKGFTTRVTDVDDLTETKTKLQVPARVHSCHTATVGGYVIEGHVPAADVQRLLKERPAVLGLAVPGMPIGSPGMELPNAKAQPYRVYTFDKQGQVQVFASHNE